MKKSFLATMLFTSAMYLGVSPGTASSQGKTRDQVKQELAQARHDGVIPSTKAQYPAPEPVIARNKEIHAVSMHSGERAPSIDDHDKR